MSTRRIESVSSYYPLQRKNPNNKEEKTHIKVTVMYLVSLRQFMLVVRPIISDENFERTMPMSDPVIRKQLEVVNRFSAKRLEYWGNYLTQCQKNKEDHWIEILKWCEDNNYILAI